MSTRTYGKKLVLRAPIVDISVGQSLEGVVHSKRAEVQTKFKPTPVMNLELLEDFKYIKYTPSKKSEKPQVFKKGEIVAMFIKAGLVAAMELPEGTECRITCTGTVDTGKGNPAYTYEVEHN